MEFRLSDEQQQFADALRRWTQRGYGFEHRQQSVREGRGSRAADWAALAELGLPALGVPAEQDGLGASGIEHMIAMQEAGRALLAEPLWATLWGCAFLRAAPGHEELLSRVATGEARLACAVEGDAAGITCRARREGDGWHLAGSKTMVVHGAQADALIVSAQGDAGVTLFVVPADALGLSRRDHATIDGLRAALVTFEDVQLPHAAMLGAPGHGAELLDAASDFGAALLCAEAIGVMEVLMEDTLEHLRNRQQFGSPIAKFQALQHRMAECFIHLEQSRSLVMLAAARCEHPDADERRRCVSAAKVRVNDALRFVGQQCVQLHGGLGVSDEVRVTHLFKRATAIEFTLGDSDHHLTRFTARPAFATA